MTAALVLLFFWGPPVALAVLLVRWHRRQPAKSQIAGAALSAVLALVLWWFILIGVVGGASMAVSDLIDGLYASAALLAALLVMWSLALVLVIRNALGRAELPIAVINYAALCAIGLGVPLEALVMVASVI